jgi:Outer membrane receptor for ferrienterochelin and colicins
MQKRLHFLLALMLFFTTSIMAQVTTSSINGKVVAGNEDVIGATVTAVHVPSGTTYNAVTNSSGRYTIQGMRVGGPYKVTISYIGYKNEERKGLNLELGEATVIDADLKEDARELGEVVVSGVAGKGGMGASSNFNQKQIENAPTVDRNIYDVAKLSPLVSSNKFGGITIAGSNNRYNSFQIDGMVANDVFGLAASGTNGGQTGANPISMDAVEQIQVVASPFDVRQSGFTGGAINAITKSGTNDFHGSAYTYYTDENMYSRWSPYYNMTQKLTNETTKTYGATFGGPIIKDKLFFFGSVEYKKDEYPASYWAGSSNYFMTQDLAAAMADKYYAVTGIKESYNRRNLNTDALSILGRIDWNINSNNHFSIRYQLNDSYKDNYSVGTYSYTFNNSGYKQKDKTNSFVAELTSHISQSLYNELRVGASFIRDKRETPYSGPNIYISYAPGYDMTTHQNTTGSYTYNMGTEFSSGANTLNQDIYTVEDNLSWYLGNHTLTFGTHNEFYNMKNMFIQAAYGEYTFKTVADFFNDNVNSFIWKYSDPTVTGTSRWATPFKAGQLGVYVQDKWDLSTALQLTYGIRIDKPVYFNSPSTNTDFNATTFSTANDAVVGRKPNSSIMISPRFGFRWFADNEHKTTIRGGAGIFNGRAPFVWIENAWANTGIEMKGTTIYSPNAPSFTQYGGKTPAEAMASAPAGKGDLPVINTIDKNFKFPQVFRTNLAWEQMLPYGVKMTIEGLYSKNLNNVWFENLALVDQGIKVYAADGSEASATNFYKSSTGSYKQIINMRNTDKGHSYSLSAKFEKSFDFGLDLMASYTFSHSYSVNDGTSSTASSSWAYYYCVDPNKAVVGKSMFDQPHRVIATAAYNTKPYGNGRWASHASLTYNGYSGQRYSLIMGDANAAKNTSFNNDSQGGNTLLYIPTATELSNMKMSASDQTSFETWIMNDKYARNHRGQYAEKNSNSAPWENHFDLHFSQDFIWDKSHQSKVSLVFDILNVANMLNHNWGTFYDSGYSQQIITCNSVTKAADGTNMVGNFSYAGQSPKISDYSSRWHMQVGLRVTF